MAIPPSGPITMGMINTELGRPATQVISLNEASVRALAQVPAGMISLSNFYGKSAAGTLGWSIGFWGAGPGFSNNAGTWEWNMANDTGQNIPAASPTGTIAASFGNTSTKSYVKGLVTTTPVNTMAMTTLDFSTKTFSSIGNVTTPGPPSMGSNYAVVSRIQTSDAFYVLGKGSLPGPSANAQQRWSKFVFSTESWPVQNQSYTTFSPAPANDWSGSYISWTAAKNYSKGFAGVGTAIQMEMSFPTDTASATFGGFNYSLGVAGPLTARVASNGCVQNSEFGYCYGGLQGTGTVAVVDLGRLVFSSKTWVRSYTSMGTSPQGRMGFMGLQNPTHGYFLGGLQLNLSPPAPPGFISEIKKFAFATQTISLVPSSMPARNLRPYESQSASVLG